MNESVDLQIKIAVIIHYFISNNFILVVYICIKLSLIVPDHIQWCYYCTRVYDFEICQSQRPLVDCDVNMWTIQDVYFYKRHSTFAYNHFLKYIWHFAIYIILFIYMMCIVHTMYILDELLLYSILKFTIWLLNGHTSLIYILIN